MKLTQRNYFSKKANEHYFSVSQYKSFERCQHAALAEIKGKYEREETTALLVGSYIDSYFEGTLANFIKAHPGIYKKNGELKAEYQQAETIIQRILKDKVFMEHLSGRKQVIMTGIICGVPTKIKIDSLLPDKIVDLKIMADFKPHYDEDKGLQPWFEYWGYDLQGAVYQEIVYQNTGKRLPFYLAAATKEKITDIDIVHVNQPILDFALTRFKSDIELYDAIKKGVIEPDRCEKCEYCKQTKTLTQPTEAEEFYLLGGL